MKVRIKNEGCALYPHNTIHEVSSDPKKEYYSLVDRISSIPKKWCEEIPDSYLDLTHYLDHFDYKHSTKILSSTFAWNKFPKGISWNKFRTLGYYTDGEKTNFFTEDEYNEFEKYSKEYNLNINYKL